jgi:hypothetical protein
MAVDWNLDLGNIITFALVIIGGVGAFFAMRVDLRGITMRLGSLEGIVAKVAVQTARLDHHAGQIERLQSQMDDIHAKRLAKP